MFVRKIVGIKARTFGNARTRNKGFTVARPGRRMPQHTHHSILRAIYRTWTTRVTARGNRGKRPGAARPENENVQPFANADKKDSGTFAFVRRQHPTSALALTGGVGGCPPDVGGVAVGGKGGLDNRGGTDSLRRGEDGSPSARFRRLCGHFERWICTLSK